LELKDLRKPKKISKKSSPKTEKEVLLRKTSYLQRMTSSILTSKIFRRIIGHGKCSGKPD